MKDERSEKRRRKKRKDERRFVVEELWKKLVEEECECGFFNINSTHMIQLPYMTSMMLGLGE